MRLYLAAALQRIETRQRSEILNGLILHGEGLKGRRAVTMPTGWEEVSPRLAQHQDAALRALSQSLSLTFGSVSALTALRERVMDSQAEPGLRRDALDSLLGARDKNRAPLTPKRCSRPSRAALCRASP